MYKKVKEITKINNINSSHDTNIKYVIYVRVCRHNWEQRIWIGFTN